MKGKRKPLLAEDEVISITLSVSLNIRQWNQVLKAVEPLPYTLASALITPIVEAINAAVEAREHHG